MLIEQNKASYLDIKFGKQPAQKGGTPQSKI